MMPEQPRLADPELVEERLRERLVEMQRLADVNKEPREFEQFIRTASDILATYTERQAELFLMSAVPGRGNFHYSSVNLRISSTLTALVSTIEKYAGSIPLRHCRKCKYLHQAGAFCELCIPHEFPYAPVQDELYLVWKQVKHRRGDTYTGMANAPYTLGQVCCLIGPHNWLFSPLGAIKDQRLRRDYVMAALIPRRRVYLSENFVITSWGSVLPVSVHRFTEIDVTAKQAFHWLSDINHFAPLVDSFEQQMRVKALAGVEAYQAEIDEILAEDALRTPLDLEEELF